MYYASNLKTLGDLKIISYSNKFINNYMLGCRYADQDEVNKLIPIIEDVVPQDFIQLLNNEIF